MADKKEKDKSKGKGKQKQPTTSPVDPIALEMPEGKPLLTINADAVGVYRPMLTRLLSREPLPPRVALVAALPEEGVTYNSIALAATLTTDLPQCALVVELNWWRPGLARTLGEVESKGVAGLLDGSVTAEQAIVPTKMSNLKFLPAGELAVEKRAEIARSQALRDVIKELAAQCDYLFLDIPALRFTSDAIPLAQLANACMVVVRQGATPVGEVQRALDDVENMKMLGVIMNRVVIKTPKFFMKLLPPE